MIRLIKPYILFEDIEEDFRKVFDSGIFTKGSYVDNFNNALCTYTNAKKIYFTTSATTALWTCLKSLNLTEGDEVVVSDFSFPATANVVEDLKLRPVFADVDKDTFNVTPDNLLKVISPKTKAFIFVDALGNPAGIHLVNELCRKKGIILIEDAACAIGSSENGKKTGSISGMTCFSFHPRKLLTTGEGGAITIQETRYTDFFDIKLNHGAKYTNGTLDFITYGYNFRLPDLQCIMGLAQLQKLDKIIDERNSLRTIYCNRLERFGFVAQHIPSNVRFNVQSLVFIVPKDCNRNALITYLKQHQIESIFGTYSLSNTTYYRKKYQNVQQTSLYLEKNTITLPCYRNVDYTLVCDVIENFIRKQ